MPNLFFKGEEVVPIARELKVESLWILQMLDLLEGFNIEPYNKYLIPKLFNCFLSSLFAKVEKPQLLEGCVFNQLQKDPQKHYV
jgi:hypothetical protein